MTRHGGRAPRRRLARALGVERFEERSLLSTVGLAPDPPMVGPVVIAAPVPPLVSLISADPPVPPRIAESIGEIMPASGGMAGGSTATAPVSSPLANLAVPAVGAIRAVEPDGPMATGFSDALQVAIDRGFSLDGTALTIPPTVGDIGSATTASSSQTTAEIATTSSAVEAQAEVSPVIPFVGIPSPPIAAAASLTASGGTFIASKQAGESTLANGPPGAQVAVASLGGLMLPPGVAALLSMSVNVQGNFTFSAVGYGNGSPPEGGVTISQETGNSLFIWTSASELPIPAPPPPVLFTTSAYFVLAPLFAKTSDLSFRNVASSASALGAVANAGTATIVVEIGPTTFASCGSTKALVSAGRALSTDSGLLLAWSGLAATATSRDVPDWRNPDIADTVETDPQLLWDVADPFVPVDLTPQRLGLITDFSPLDRLAVEQTIDQFFEQLELLGARLSSIQQSIDVTAELLALAIAVTAWIIVPKILRRSSGDSGLAAYDDATSLDGISGLAGSTSLEES
jgi:hypothetical protein